MFLSNRFTALRTKVRTLNLPNKPLSTKMPLSRVASAVFLTLVPTVFFVGINGPGHTAVRYAADTRSMRSTGLNTFNPISFSVAVSSASRQKVPNESSLLI